jgi:hypothetical protein
MLQIHSENQSVNGSKPVNGRGLQRRKLSDDEIVKLAVDLATGVRSFQPSIEQACALTGAPRRAVALRHSCRLGMMRPIAIARSRSTPSALPTFGT